MPNPPEPDHGPTPKRPGFAPPEAWSEVSDEYAGEAGAEATESYPVVPDDPETETVVIKKPERDRDPDPDPEPHQPERRFTAPGFDAPETTVIGTPSDPATEVFASRPKPGTPTPRRGAPPPKPAMPQSIPPRLGAKLRTSGNFNWGWVLAVVVVVLALAAIAILGTVLLTRSKHSKAAPEDEIRQTISFDVAVRRGDLTALRTITCETTRDCAPRASFTCSVATTTGSARPRAASRRPAAIQAARFRQTGGSDRYLQTS